MKVAGILATKPSTIETIGPDATVERAAQRLRTAHVGALVVSTDGKHINGLISERDIVFGLGKYGQSLLNMRVRDVMRRNGPVCRVDDTVLEVMAQMTHSRVRHVPVVDRGELRGIVSIGDVVKSRLDENEREINVLRDVYITRH